MKKRNAKIDAYLRKAEKWQEEMTLLREILLGFPLIEELKWGIPFYAIEGGNVSVIWSFKQHCALGFCKGALLKDPKRLLVKPGENTQAVRKIIFTNRDEIIAIKPILKSYIKEAIEIERAGLEVEFKKLSEFKMPDELEAKLNKNSGLKKAFEALTPGRQRGYFIYFSDAKHSKTREARIEKCVPQILKGKGFNER